MPTNDDLEKRSDDYEHRLMKAGSTQGIIGGLVKSAKRNQRTVRWLVISLIVDVALSFALGGLTLVAYHNDHAVDEQARLACLQSVQNSFVVNDLIDDLITNARTSLVFGPAEKESRIAGYKKLIIKIPDCK